MTEKELALLNHYTLLGEGCSRKVYISPIYSDIVIKICVGFDSLFQNVVEYKTWQAVKDTNFSEWFAPCRHISTDGRVLIMDRTTPLEADTVFPTEIPEFFSDIKKSSFGVLNDRFVCHDYGINNLFNVGIKNCSMKKLEWLFDEE